MERIKCRSRVWSNTLQELMNSRSRADMKMLQSNIFAFNYQLVFEKSKSTEDLSFSWAEANCASREALDNWRELVRIGKVIINTTENWSPTEDVQNHSTTGWVKLQKAFLPQKSCCQTSTCRCRSVLNKLETLELVLNMWQDKT